MKKQKGITLIALIITIIVLLILAGISINAIVGDNGVIVKAKWSGYVQEYEAVNEKKEIYAISKDMGRYIEKFSKNRKQLDPENSEDLALLKEIYPIKGEQIELSDSRIVQTLINTIYEIDGIEAENCMLYEVDFGKIDIKVKKEYVLNLKTGMLYSIQGEDYQNKIWHTTKLGVDKEITSSPKKITLIYDANGGSPTPPSQIGNVINGKAKFDINGIEPTKDRWTFKGWRKLNGTSLYKYNTSSDYIEIPDSVSNSVTLYAVWEREYKLKYDANAPTGCTVSGMPDPIEEPKTSEDVQAVFNISPTEPTISNAWSFQGWNEKADGSGSILYKNNTANDTITVRESDLDINDTKILYAIWTQEKRTVTIKVNNNSYGTVSQNTIEVSKGDTFSVNGTDLVINGTTITVSINNLDGYNTNFTGWTISGTNVTTGTINDDITIIANFSRETVYLSYNIGDTVMVGGELFYVLEDSDGTVETLKLITKYNLEKTKSDGENPTNWEQAINATYSSTACNFCSTSGFGSGFTNGENLNNKSSVINDSTSAVYKAKEYGRYIANLAGDSNNETGRLLTKDEFDVIYALSSSSNKIATMLWGMENIQGDGSNYLYYWCSTAVNSNEVFGAGGKNHEFGNKTYNESDYLTRGVRPVITISKKYVTPAGDICVVTVKVNDNRYGKVSKTSKFVSRGTTFSTSEATLNIDTTDTTVITASVINANGYNTTFENWTISNVNVTNGTINSDIVIVANFKREPKYAAYSIGDSVKVGGEEFYVLKNSAGTEEKVKLITKYNLEKTINQGSNSTKWEQAKDATRSATACNFCSASGFGSGFTNGEDLNNKNSVINDSTSAVYKAMAYAKDVTNNDTESTGRLLTKTEFEELYNMLGSNSNIKKLLCGQGNASENFDLWYWTSTATGNNKVFGIGCERNGNILSGDKIYAGSTDLTRGVRPVIEVPKSLVISNN